MKHSNELIFSGKILNNLSKTFITIITVLISLQTLNAQQFCEIRDDGILVPVLDHTTIAGPLKAHLVFDINTNTLWLYNGNAWVEQNSGGSSLWTLNGSDISYSSGIVQVNGSILTGVTDIGDFNFEHIEAFFDGQFFTNLEKKINLDGRSIQATSKNTFAAQNTQESAPLGLNPYGGYVGIGTKNPDELFELRFTGNEGMKLTGDDSGDAFIQISNGGGTHSIFDDFSSGNDLDIQSANDIAFNTGGATQNMLLESSGQLGIGITPSSKLHVFSNTFVAEVVDFTADDITGNNDLLNLTAGAGTADNAQMIEVNRGTTNVFSVQGDGSLKVNGGKDAGYTSDGYVHLGQTSGINLVLDENEILARNNGAESELFIQRDGGDLLLCALEGGQVGIGITSVATLPDPSFLLAVDGKAIFEEVQVLLSGDWPDYVFEEDYDLLSLSETEDFINENGHLPNIPSACEVENSGIAVGEMQKLMMEKIEEVTLHLIALEKENELLKAEITNLKNK